MFHKGFRFVSLEQEKEHQHHPRVKGNNGCRPHSHREAEEHTMHEVNIDFTTVAKNLIECMTMIDRDSSHGFQLYCSEFNKYSVCGKNVTSLAAKTPLYKS